MKYRANYGDGTAGKPSGDGPGLCNTGPASNAAMGAIGKRWNPRGLSGIPLSQVRA